MKPRESSVVELLTAMEWKFGCLVWKKRKWYVDFVALILNRHAMQSNPAACVTHANFFDIFTLSQFPSRIRMTTDDTCLPNLSTSEPVTTTTRITLLARYCLSIVRAFLQWEKWQTLCLSHTRVDKKTRGGSCPDWNGHKEELVLDKAELGQPG